jgi:ABC-2 type transport system ATP-binding protein
MPPILHIDDLQKRYGDFVALHGVSFEVAEGEMFGLLGPNGAGKTTLLSILSCLIPASAGRATLLGRPVSPDDKELRRRIALVPQDLAVYGELTARENLTFFGKLYGLGGAKLKDRVDAVLEAVALADRADHRSETFSGGMKRRLNLGVGLIHEPRLIMLDEPTTGVDPQSRNRIFEEVRRINAAGTTVVYTSHYMEEVQALCTRIGIIDHGKLIACDPLPDLLRKLGGLVELRVRTYTAALRERLKVLPGVDLTEMPDGLLRLACENVNATVVRLVGVLNEQNAELVALETQEPNLERVFLHLTGRGLRD